MSSEPIRLADDQLERMADLIAETAVAGSVMRYAPSLAGRA